MSSTACLVGSSTASKRRRTVIGRITSRYLPRTYRSRSTSSAMPQMKLAIQFSCPCSIQLCALQHLSPNFKRPILAARQQFVQRSLFQYQVLETRTRASALAAIRRGTHRSFSVHCWRNSPTRIILIPSYLFICSRSLSFVMIASLPASTAHSMTRLSSGSSGTTSSLSFGSTCIYRVTGFLAGYMD